MRVQDDRPNFPGLRKSSTWRYGLLCLVAAVAVPLGIALSQTAGTTSIPTAPRDPGGLPPISPLANRQPDGVRMLEDSMHSGLDRKRIEMLNVMRQKQMAEETAKLVALATEVKSETGQGQTDQLSVEELRKVEQIEKLARSVQNKMKASVGN